MELIYKGKTKDVYKREDGSCVLKFKDDVTGTDGVFDPGANTVGLKMDGAGMAGLRLTEYFFKLLEEKGIPTHYIDSNIEENTMTVHHADPFGKGLEVICRFRATGSFIRRYGSIATEGQPLDALVEITLKDDDRGDPLITKDALKQLDILTFDEYETLTKQCRDICIILKDELAKFGGELIDIKLEFGRCFDGVRLIDEIAGGNMRVYDKDGKGIKPLDLTDMVCGKILK